MSKRKVHQPKPLIQRINTRKIIENHIAQQAVKEEIFTETKRALYFSVIALNLGLNIGELRILRDFVPAMNWIERQYIEWQKAGGTYYADKKTEEMVKKIMPSQDVTIGHDVLVLNDGTVIR